MKCHVKERGVIREKRENEEVFVDRKKVEKPLGVDLDLGAVRYAVGQRAEVVYGRVEVKEKKEQKTAEKPRTSQRTASKTKNTKRKTSSTGPSGR